MFGSRRHRPPSQPLTAATANPNAATAASAAASAFSRQTSSSSLSSAAAAAALKARPHTPTNVSEVQTRRTRRRSASVASAGSRDGGSGLKRSPSVGSMSERSLRSTSPHRPAARKPAEEPPPVPSIPDHAVPTSSGDAREKNTYRHTQSSNLGSDAAKGGPLSWFVPPPSTDSPQRIRTSHDSDGRPRSSGSSINFSYPRGSRVASPTPDSPPTDRPMSRLSPAGRSTTGSAEELVYDPNSRRMIPKSESLALEHKMKEPRRKSTRKKKPTSALSSNSGAGSSLSPSGSLAKSEKATEALGSSETPELDTGSVRRHRDAELFMEPKTKANEGLRSSAPALSTTHREGVRATPSPSRQVPDYSRYRAYQPPSARVHEISGNVEHHNDAFRSADAASVNTSTYPDHRGPVELPAEYVDKTPQVEPPGRSSPESDRVGNQDSKEAPAVHHKTVSIAPKGKLVVPVRHSPPPRAASPIKSALKHSVGSNRNSSVSDYGSEVSADTSHQHLDPAVARKKSVRVSFDDESVISREAAVDKGVSEDTRTASLPVAKKRWYSLPKRRNSEASTEGEEVMKPRPMLPSFGSIRDKKTKSHEERPLVRPHAFTSSSPPAHLPTIPSDPDLGGHGAGFSSDHAIGTALTDGLAHRHGASASSLREPLPPQVTSVEGDGLMSDDSSDFSLLNSEDEEHQEPLVDDAPDAAPAPAAPESEAIHAEPSASDTKGEDNKNAIDSDPTPASNIGSPTSVPQIAVSGPSPQPKEGDVPDSPRSSESEEFFEIPGTFPDKQGADTETSASWRPPQIIKSWLWGTEPESGPDQSEASKSQAEEAETFPDPKSEPAHGFPSTVEEETEESGVFSDAYEDLSDIEEDGFQSLAAVAAQPVRSEVSQEASNQAPPSPAKETEEPKENTGAAETSGPVQGASEGAPSMDWEQAKAFWKSLSTEKRKQLELEAMQEAGVEGDLDESRPPVKPKKKKSVKREQSKPEEGLPAGSSTKNANARQDRRFLRKSLRGARPGSSDGAVTAPQQQSERQGMLRSLRSPPPTSPTGTASERGMRKSLRTQRPPDPVPIESPRSTEKRPLSLPTPTLGFPQKLRAKPSKRPMSSEESSQRPGTADWTASLPRRRGSFSSESSFKRSTPRPGSSGFRKTMRPGADSPGMVPGSSAGRMGSFSLRSSPPPHGAFRRNSSFGSSPSASPASMMRRGANEGGWRHHRLFSFKGFSRKGGRQSARDLDDSSDDEDVAAELPSSPTRLHRPATANGATPTKAAPAPGNGVPQEQREELSDSESEPDQTLAAGPAASPSANGSLSHSRSGRGSQSKPKSKGKGGLMSALRRRKADRGGVSRPERTESAARRDTKLERSAAELEALRSPTPGQGHPDEDDDSAELSLPSPRRKLEKRGGPQGAGKESPEGKKKKFSALRRVFKMHE